MILIKSLKPEKLIFSMDHYIKQRLGAAFLENDLETFDQILNDSDCTTVILFILSPSSQGNDPGNIV
jgi:dynein heavy chain